MVITGDYHTHTKYSKLNHGKNTIAEMVEKAKDLGLESFAVTDHGPKHALFGIKRNNIEKAKGEIEGLKESAGLNLYFGIEANLMKRDGSIDLTNDEIKKLDILIVGYHKGCKNDFINLFRALFKPEKQKAINTEAYINCINKYDVDIISHLNEYIKVDVFKVASEAKKRGTLIEINNKHVNFTKQEAQELIDSGCFFILSSDAHKAKNVAKLDRALDFVEKYKIPHDRIVNLDKLYR